MYTRSANRGTAGWGLVVVRLALGIVFVIHGIGKFGIGPLSNGGIGGFAGFLGQIGIPAPGVFTWVVTLVELVGGLLILVGLLARIAGLLLTINMLVAVATFHLPNGFNAYASPPGYEYALVLALVSIAIVVGGDGGKLSVERALFGRELLPVPG